MENLTDTQRYDVLTDSALSDNNRTFGTWSEAYSYARQIRTLNRPVYIVSPNGSTVEVKRYGWTRVGF